ncbi:hypothetical protein [uncultured Thomasclavelia sp.]|uniref:hypothetical protein n=1 Tax=uncultured Thomasclavelia sp. TaxID=3025759 RepID=UPI00262B045E|nr:hypothetical protein [uncultured Thomasclavelia sp.]
MEEIFATDYLDIDYKIFESNGIFDPMLTKDSSFFINIIRLKNAKTYEFSNSYSRINQYFTDIATCLKHAQKKNVNDLFYRNAVKKFEEFHEVNGINLGFSESRYGAGFGKALSEQVIYDLFDIVKAGIENPEIFHLIGLFEKNVGPDRLSDMIASIILEDIKHYTKRIQKMFQIDKNNYSSYEFDSDGFLINKFKHCRVYFLPKEILHKLPVAKSWEDIDSVITENNAIKNELNALIGADLSRWAKLSSSDKKDYLRENIFKNPDFCNRVLNTYKNEELEEISFTTDDDYNINKIWQSAKKDIDFNFFMHSAKHVDSLNCARIVVENFKEWIENNGGWEIILNFASRKREKMTQRLIHLCALHTVKENNLDFSCEVNNGHGPVDFKISRGNDKTVIELKLSSNTQYMHGYTDQIRQYAKSENTDNMIYVLVNIGHAGRVKKLEEKVEEDGYSDEVVPKLYVIDATEQVSASVY